MNGVPGCCCWTNRRIGIRLVAGIFDKSHRCHSTAEFCQPGRRPVLWQVDGENAAVLIARRLRLVDGYSAIALGRSRDVATTEKIGVRVSSG